MTLALGDVYRDAWQVYRLLMKRSVATAAVVYGLVTLVQVAEATADGSGAQALLWVAYLCAMTAGPVLVQGALVEIVRNIHEGRRPQRIADLYAAAGGRFWSLLWAAVVYGLGVFFGLLLLVVPGLFAAARWCLMAPLIMLEHQSAEDARQHSSELVRGRTAPVLGIVVATFLLIYVPGGALGIATRGAWYGTVVGFVWTCLTAPFEAHVLTVIYYRLTEPERPVVHADVLLWESVWNPPDAAV